MNLRHVAVLALIGWYLSISPIGKTAPKDIPDLALTFGMFSAQVFETKEECEKAGQDFVRQFYANARKNGEQVALPPNPQCVEGQAK
jgi:hypothetical protein